MSKGCSIGVQGVLGASKECSLVVQGMFYACPRGVLCVSKGVLCVSKGCSKGVRGVLYRAIGVQGVSYKYPRGVLCLSNECSLCVQGVLTGSERRFPWSRLFHDTKKTLVL